ncbi:hypothetical protein QYE76_024293 [Lolium multiflorum]|uniref:Transposase (putative) gypsy type domain-containing protein n=1 Tax=Lolium multiflorum TaxID=4521 RepID=A0AAD8RDP4_LOLMU|nr:hypothetical protein QYE76_024293 [Lolium multiflorum]
MFMSFLYRGLSLPAHEFLWRLLHTYEIQLWQLTPNSILHLAIFITLCEAFLGIEPHFGLWKKIFFVKRYNCSSGSFVTGGVGFVVQFRVEENANLEDEDNDPTNPEAFSIDPKSFADDMSNTAKSNHDDDVDRAAFVNAAEEANVLPLKRSSGGFADEDDLDLDKAFIEPPPKKTKPSSDKPAPAASEASAPATAPAAQFSTASSLSKGKEIPLTAAAAAPPPEKHVIPVSSFTEGPSNGSSEKDRLERMKSRIAQMEKGMRGIHAMAAIIKNKGKLATDAERYALMELHKATESLNCKYPDLLALCFFESNPLTLSSSLPLIVISLNSSEEKQRVHERVDSLTRLASFDEVFWKDHSKAFTIAKFQDRVQQVHRFFDKCYTCLRVIWKTMFPLNKTPSTLLTLFSEFGNVKKIKSLIRTQLIAAAEIAFALVLSKHPSANLMAIANADGSVGHLYSKTRVPAAIAVERLEENSKVNDEAGTSEKMA